MRHPPALAAGDRIAVVSPAGPVTEEILAPGLERLRSWGFDVAVDADTYRRDDCGYLAGPDDVRLASVQDAFASPEIDGVVFSRGGYGTMRLLPQLDLETLVETPKLVVGFSDLTALHLHAAGCRGIATLHGPVVKSLRQHDASSRTLRALRRALTGERDAPFEVDGLTTLRSGRASGPLLGGNLTVLVNMLGTPYAPDLTGAVVLVEETGEEDYRLDRMLTSLRLRAEREPPAALVFGDFVDCEGVYVEEDEIEDYVASLGREFDCPVVAGAPVGHAERNVPLPMGVQAEVDADAGTLRFERDAVRSNSPASDDS